MIVYLQESPLRCFLDYQEVDHREISSIHQYPFSATVKTKDLLPCKKKHALNKGIASDNSPQSCRPDIRKTEKPA